LVLTSPKVIWWIFCTAAASLLPMLFLQYEGEEPFFTIFAQEMWANREFIVTTHFGTVYPRPGLFPWLIVALSNILGWANVLIAARLVAITATILTGLTLAWLVFRLFADRLLAVVAAAIFLSGDVLLYRGWLAYADPLFAFFTFGAMACLWVATNERRNDLLVLAALGLIGAFLAKVLTAYAFYGVLGLVLLWKHENRFFLIRPASLALHALAVAFPLVWTLKVVGGAYFDNVVLNVLKLPMHPPSSGEYIKHVLLFPLSTVGLLLPASALAAYGIVRSGKIRPNLAVSDIALWTACLNLIPYWLVPGSQRYLLPILPLFALPLAQIIVRSGEFVISLTAKVLMANIAVALIASMAAIPLYQRYVRGDYAELARMIMARTKNEPIYATDDTAVGSSLVANLNTLRAPRPPIVRPPSDFKSGYVLARDTDDVESRVYLTFSVGRNADGQRTRYLLCRGAACEGKQP